MKYPEDFLGGPHCFPQRAVNQTGSHFQAFGSLNGLLNPLRVFTIESVGQHSLDGLPEFWDRQFARQRLEGHHDAGPGMGDARSHPRLVIGDRNGHHGYTGRQRLERRIQAGVGNAERSPLQHLKLGSAPDHNGVGRQRPNLVRIQVLADGQDQLAARA